MRITNFFMFVIVAGFMFVTTTVSAGSFSTTTCKACHKLDYDSVGPAWKTVVDKYGDAKNLAAVLRAGFKVEDRKVAQSAAKWKGQAGIMTSQYNSLIKKGGNEDAAAEALFAAVKAGKM